jgi:hypothetical protein
MNKLQVIEYMQQSKDIQDWNKRRQFCKWKFQGSIQEFAQTVDCSGLVVQVLGKDPIKK